MTLEMARSIKIFLNNNDITFYINLMGGEFFCHPNWIEIFSILVEGVELARIVTNGDWAANPGSIIEFMKDHPHCYFCISQDRWHTNTYVEKALEICKENDIIVKVATEEQTQPDSIVPAGRSRFEYNLYSSLGQYCTKPERKYEFLIDEQGEIYKCDFGAWIYANVSEYQEGGFAVRFKNFNTMYYSQWVPNCKQCLSAWRRNEK